MRRTACLIALSLTIATVAAAQPSLPAGLTNRTIATPDGAQIYVRYGGSGPVDLLIHGFGDTGEMWGPVVRGLEHTTPSSFPISVAWAAPRIRKTATTRGRKRPIFAR